MVEKSHTAGWWPNVYEPLRTLGQKVADWFAPRSDAAALDGYYEINMELPGIRTEDVRVAFEDNHLTISGEKRTERTESNKSYFFSEREYGSFQRSFRLPPDADGGKIDAEFKDGVLTVRIAKRSAAKPEGRTIDIRTS